MCKIKLVAIDLAKRCYQIGAIDEHGKILYAELNWTPMDCWWIARDWWVCISRFDLPQGFEYELAEIGSGSSTSRGNVPLDLNESYAQLAYIHMNNHGLVRHRPRAA